MRREPENPIVDGHVAFAKELVALARKHGCGSLTVEFRLSSSVAYRKGDWNPANVKFQWHEGRHGVASSTTLTATSTVYVEETTHDR